MFEFKTTTGRKLAWSEWGARDGRVVVFCPGAGMAGALPFGSDAAERLSLRIISVDRPGLGGSDEHREKNFESWAKDIAELLKSFGCDTAPVIGFSQGAVFALALGAHGVASSVTAVSGTDELTHPEVKALLSEQISGFVQYAENDPAGLEREIAGSASAEWLWQMIETMSGNKDREIYARDDFAPAYREALAQGFRQGAAGYARDTVLASAAWPFRVEDINCPVYLWYGLEDMSPVHSPDHGAILASRITGAKLMQIEGHGSAILWTHATEILTAI